MSVIAGYTWWASRKRYTYIAGASIGGRKNKKVVYMHRLILKAPSGFFVDHINGDGLDNRRSNLRLCTIKENNRNRVRMQSTNTSGLRGVFWERGCQKWRAQITVDDKNKHLGVFTDKYDAAIAYRNAAQQYYGEFAARGWLP